MSKGATPGSSKVQPYSPFPLPRPNWVPDAEAPQCNYCNSTFSSLNRRHHCRQCGNVFCKVCCGRKMPLPQFGYDRPERVCERCMEVAFYVSYVLAESPATQVAGVRRLADVAKRNDTGMHKLVSLGGIDGIIFSCHSSNEEVLSAAMQALNLIAQNEEVQHTLVVKGALVALFRVCTSKQVQNLNTLFYASNTLFTLSRNSEVCRAMVADNGLHALMSLCSRTLPSGQSSPSDETALAEVQAQAARAISYLAMTSVNQGKIIEDKNNGLEQLLALLTHSNPNVRKYIAKTFAYLSLRNEKLKARVLRSDGVEALVGLLKKGNLRETLSHASCTIANLATNGDSNEALLNHGRLVSALCELSASLTDDSEIQRHIIRGLANFALYDSNKAALVSAVPEIVRLGHVASSDIQRHAIRAIDNLLIVPNDEILRALRSNNVGDLLRQLAASSSVNADVAKRAAAALERLELPDEERKEEEAQMGSAAETTSSVTLPAIPSLPVPAAEAADEREETAERLPLQGSTSDLGANGESTTADEGADRMSQLTLDADTIAEAGNDPEIDSSLL